MKKREHKYVIEQESTVVEITEIEHLHVYSGFKEV